MKLSLLLTTTLIFLTSSLFAQENVELSKIENRMLLLNQQREQMGLKILSNLPIALQLYIKVAQPYKSDNLFVYYAGSDTPGSLGISSAHGISFIHSKFSNLYHQKGQACSVDNLTATYQNLRSDLNVNFSKIFENVPGATSLRQYEIDRITFMSVVAEINSLARLATGLLTYESPQLLCEEIQIALLTNFEKNITQRPMVATYLKSAGVSSLGEVGDAIDKMCKTAIDKTGGTVMTQICQSNESKAQFTTPVNL